MSEVEEHQSQCRAWEEAGETRVCRLFVTKGASGVLKSSIKKKKKTGGGLKRDGWRAIGLSRETKRRTKRMVGLGFFE